MPVDCLTGGKMSDKMTFGIYLILFFAVTLIRTANGKSLEFQSLYRRLPQHHLRALPQKVLTNLTVEDCAKSCVMETEFECKSFDYDNRHIECHLHNHTYTEPLVGLQETIDVDHYRAAYEKLFNRIPNHVISMHHNRNIRGLTVEGCARRCILELSFKCRGFDFERLSRNCWLTDKVSHDVGGLKRRANTDYYERQSNGPLSRFINYGYGALQSIEGIQTHNKILLGVNLDACAQLCLAETAFQCNSFDYVFREQSCQMSQYIAANVHGMRTEFETRHQVMHYELIDEYLNYFYPTPYASVLGNNERTFKKVTPNTCARKCLEERDFVCRSFDYQIQRGTCLLSHVTGSDVGGLYAPEGFQVHHFEMKPSLDCGGLLTGERDTFASPNWPRRYSHHLNCTWTIIVSKYKIVHVDIYHLDLGWHGDSPCDRNNDQLIFAEDSSQGRQSSCVSNRQREFISTTNKLDVTFITNAETDAQGFRIFYSADWPCRTVLSSDNGEFASPRWPNTYPALSDCQWTIQGPRGSRVVLMFNSIELEDHTGSSCRTAFDTINIYDGVSVNDTRMHTYCGNTEPDSVTSSGEGMLVTFESDSRVQAKGFHASYKFLYATTTTTTTTEATTTTQSSTTDANMLVNQTLDDIESDTISSVSTVHNMSVAVHLAIVSSNGDKEEDTVVKMVATFVEPPILMDEEKSTDNKKNVTNNKIGVTGDDVGMGIHPEVSYDKKPSDREYTVIIWGVTVAFLIMFLVMVTTIMLVCRYYRRRIPKLRQGTNIDNLEENVSLCHKNGLTAGRAADFQDEVDVDEAARLPLPGNHEAPPDVEFHNPLFIARPSNSVPPDLDTPEQVDIDSPDDLVTVEEVLDDQDTESDTDITELNIDSADGRNVRTDCQPNEARVRIDCFTTV